MYGEGFLGTFRFGCFGMLKQIFSAEILKTSSMDVTQTNGRFLHVIFFILTQPSHLAMALLACYIFESIFDYPSPT